MHFKTVRLMTIRNRPKQTISIIGEFRLLHMFQPIKLCLNGLIESAAVEAKAELWPEFAPNPNWGALITQQKGQFLVCFLRFCLLFCSSKPQLMGILFVSEHVFMNH